MLKKGRPGLAQSRSLPAFKSLAQPALEECQSEMISPIFG